MNYSIYKDDNVVSTVDKIIKILDSVKIKVKEHWYSVPTTQNYIPGYSSYPSNCDFIPYSLRISFYDIHELGTNGKGTSKENARASAYAEFMERLQNQCLSNNFLMLYSNQFSFAPDEKEIDQETKKFLSKYKYTKIFNYCQIDKLDDIPLKKVCIPYFNIKNKKLNYIPPLKFVFCTNGMASGNTPEEALVQGFSEICERYSFKQVVFNNISMPDIPKKYYEQYETIEGLISYAEQLGWKVSIKDASIGKGLPTICTIFENQSLGIFTYKFGSQPSLPIAIERTITEFFQGGVPKDCDLMNNIFQFNNPSPKKLKHIFFELTANKWYFKISDKLYDIFFNKKYDYDFSASSWIDENKKYTNKELLKFLIDRITAITDNDILVRDVSYLGFPSYHIFIPKFSETVYYDDDKLNLFCWGNYPNKKLTVPNDVDSLISAILFKLEYENHNNMLVPNTPDEYILILCYILKNDYKNILKYCETLQKRNEPSSVRDFISNNSNLINIIYRYFKLKQQKENSTEINSIIKSLYNKEDVQKFHDLIKHLNLQFIKNIIVNAKNRTLNKTISQKDQDMNFLIDNIKQILIQRYIENTPDQMELKKIFDFDNIN